MRQTDSRENYDRQVVALQERGTKTQTLLMQAAETARKNHKERKQSKKDQRGRLRVTLCCRSRAVCE